MLDNQTRIENLKESNFQEIFGVKKDTFFKLLSILEEAFKELHKYGGKPPKLSIFDKLVITLCYYREYRTMQHITFDYGVVKSAICDAVHWVEGVLIKQEEFHLPGKKALLKNNQEIEAVLIESAEHEIKRPKKTKAHHQNANNRKPKNFGNYCNSTGKRKNS